MKFTGDLENFQPSSVLQWIEADRLSGILALQTDSAGYRLRFAEGQLVSTSLWPAELHLYQFLLQHQALDKADLELLRQEASRRAKPLSDLLGEKIPSERIDSLMQDRARETGYGLLQENRGRFFFAEACHELPESLETPINVAALVMESVRQQDEESRLQEWMPAADQRLLIGPSQAQSDLQKVLIDHLDDFTTREELENGLPFEGHEIRLEIARSVRDGRLRCEATNTPTVARETETVPIRRALKVARHPSPEELPFLTTVERELLQQFKEPKPLDQAVRYVDQPVDLVLAASEMLQASGMLSPASSEEHPTTDWRKRAWLGAAAVIVMSVILGLALPAMTSRSETAAPNELTAEVRESEAQEIKSNPLAVLEPNTPESIEEESPAEDSSGTQAHEASFQEAVSSARRALTANRVDQALQALEEAAGFKPGDPTVVALWRQAQELNRPSAAQAHPVEAQNPIPPIAGLTPPKKAVTKQDQPEKAQPEPTQPIQAHAGTQPGPTQPEDVQNPAQTLAVNGRLILNAIPYAFVRINGVEKGSTPLRLEMPSGSYEIEIYRADFETIQRRIDIQSDTETLETFTLRPRTEEDL